MGQVSAFLRKTSTGYAFYCPGCKEMHQVWCDQPTGANWDFNGNVEKPSFTPSVRHFHPARDGKPEKTFCHYYVTDGEIRYCGDCTHELNGQTVPLPAIPEAYSDENYGWGK